MIRTLALCLLLMSAYMAGAQTNVSIQGTMENGVGKRVELLCYEDVLTMKELLLSADTVGSNGAFEVKCYVNYPRLVVLQVEHYSQSFYVEPGRTYQVYVPPFDWDIDEHRNVHLDPVALPVEFLALPQVELNLEIKHFEELVDSFMDAHRMRLDHRFRPDRRCFDTLESLVGNHRGDTTASFLGRYIEYRLAEMRLAMGFTSRKKLIEKYITDQPVRYHDEEYMRLFLALHQYMVSKGTKRLPLWRMTEWVRKGDLATFLDSLGVEPLLRNEQVRELAALQALKEAYFMKDYDREAVLHMVDALGAQSKFTDHRRLALNLKSTLEAGERGNALPPIVLPDVEHRPVSLESLKGKWVYLSFVRTGDPNCLRELETLAHFHDTLARRYPDLVLVTIACDREFQKMYHLLRNSKRGHRYQWLWLHFDGRYSLLEHYGVVSYPTFVILAPDGRVHNPYAPAPGTGILQRGPWHKETIQQDAGQPMFRQSNANPR